MNQLKVKPESLALYERAQEALRLLGIDGWWQLRTIAQAMDIVNDVNDPDLYDQDATPAERAQDWFQVECDCSHDDPTEGLGIEFEAAMKHTTTGEAE